MHRPDDGSGLIEKPAPKFDEREIRDEIFRQYQAKAPRVGLEMEQFVEAQCEYFGISERTCRRYIGLAKIAQRAEFRGAVAQTATQDLAESMGFTPVDLLQTVWDGLRATRKRPIVDKNGRPVLGDDGKPMFFETEDWANRLTAADRAAKLIGAYAPKEVHIESVHEHNVTITDEQLRNELAGLAGRFGLSVVDAEFTAVEPGAAESKEIAPGTEVEDGRG